LEEGIRTRLAQVSRPIGIEMAGAVPVLVSGPDFLTLNPNFTPPKLGQIVGRSNASA
jgi:hypothetical protein